MTTIHAIDLLKDLEQSLDDYCELNDEGKTAFRMAITALELFGNSEQFYRFYELPEIAVSANHFKSMIPLEVEKAKGRKACGLECLRCKQTYDYSWDTMDEISYTMYSYCPDCIRKGIQLLKSQDKEGAQE